MSAEIIKDAGVTSFTSGTTVAGPAIFGAPNKPSYGDLVLTYIWSGVSKANTTINAYMGAVMIAEFDGANGYVAIYGRIIDGSETLLIGNYVGCSVAPASSAAHGVESQIWRGVGSTTPIATAGAAFAGTHTPAALTSGAVTRGGVGLGLSLWYGNGSLAGFTASGSWVGTLEFNNRAAYNKLTGTNDVSGVTTYSIQPTWTSNRGGSACLAVLPEGPKGAFMPFFPGP